MHSALVRWLEHTSEAALLTANDRRVFHFGSRDIVVSGSTATLGALNFAGLWPASEVSSSSETAVRVAVIDDAALASLPALEQYRRGAYGAFVEEGLPSPDLSGWLVCFEEDESRLLAFDRINKIALLWFAQTPPPRELAEFCRPLLHWLAIGDGNVVVHAAAIAHQGRAVLVAGAGNAGKTTLVRACLAAGLDYLGDNVVEVRLGDTSPPVVWGVYPSLKVRPGSPEFTGPLLPAPVWDDEARKDIFYLGASESVSFQPKAMQHVATLVLHESAAPQLVSATAAATFFAIAPNTVAQFPFFGAEVLHRVRRVSQQAPAYSAGRLELSSLGERVRSLLA